MAVSLRPEFSFLEDARAPEQNAAVLQRREVALELGSHEAAAAGYLASQELIDCINTALAVGAPLLLTGEPGTGKTQAAYYAAHRLGVGAPHKLDVTSETTVHDLFYEFDRVAYFHDAQVEKQRPDRTRYFTPGPLWKAFERSQQGETAIVLLDELDKAPRDFPNDLLNALDQHEFTIRELSKTIRADPRRPPLVILTSNSEKRLPEPLLRRCIYHFIPFDEAQVRKIVQRRRDFLAEDKAVHELAIGRFLELRKLPGLRKKPATGELLLWLTVLSARKGLRAEHLSGPLQELPGLFCLIKDRDDLERIGGVTPGAFS